MEPLLPTSLVDPDPAVLSVPTPLSRWLFDRLPGFDCVTTACHTDFDRAGSDKLFDTSFRYFSIVRFND